MSAVRLYTAGLLDGDRTAGHTWGREILDPEGNVICYVIEQHSATLGACEPTLETKALLSHLNKEV